MIHRSDDLLCPTTLVTGTPIIVQTILQLPDMISSVDHRNASIQMSQPKRRKNLVRRMDGTAGCIFLARIEVFFVARAEYAAAAATSLRRELHSVRLL
mmetsp:Transcript_17608/g.40595  ORF Transcript_17608/g.40595 Transcript_17608/m.40595 type:complete len:98 (+) Transcript_17608:75-368(+)